MATQKGALWRAAGERARHPWGPGGGGSFAWIHHDVHEDPACGMMRTRIEETWHR